MARSRGDGGSCEYLGGLQQPRSDIIPREYHRKVLKKIAQLTKVFGGLMTVQALLVGTMLKNYSSYYVNVM